MTSALTRPLGVTNQKHLGRTTRFFLFAAIGMIPLGRLLSRPLFESAGKTVPLSAIEIALGVLIVSYCASKLWRSQWPTTRVPGFKAIVLFPAWCCISLLINKIHFGLSAGATLFSGLYLLRWVAYSFLYFVTYEVTRDSLDARKLAKVVLGGGILFAAFGIFQAAFLSYDFALAIRPEARTYVDYDPQGHRLVSTFLDPNIAAGFILIPTMIALSFSIHGNRRWIVPLLLLVAALAATLSRGGAVGFLVGVICLFWLSRSFRKRALKASVVILILFVVVYPILKVQIVDLNKLTIDDGSAMGRLLEWQLALNAIRNNWVVGIGFNTFGYIWPQYGDGREGASAFGMENDFIMIFMLTGIVGFVIYLRMYQTMLKPLVELGNGAESLWNKAFGRGVWAATLAVMASSLFTTIILYPQIMGILWVLWALGKRLQTWTFEEARTKRLVVPAV